MYIKDNNYSYQVCLTDDGDRLQVIGADDAWIGDFEIPNPVDFKQIKIRALEVIWGIKVPYNELRP